MSDLPSILISLGIAAVALLAGALIGKRIVARTGRYIGTGAFMVGLVLALAALNWAARLGLQYGSQVEYGVDCGIIFLFGVIVGLNSPPKPPRTGK